VDPCGGQLHNAQSCVPDVCHVTFSSRGGAGSVAKQLHEGQLSEGLPSRLLTLTDSNIQSLVAKNPMLVGEAIFDFFCVRKTTESQLFSLYRNGNNRRILESVQKSDVIAHLHWTPGVLSLETIGRLARSGRGCVWTLHDMWPFTGGCHHAGDCRGFITRCENCPQVRKAFNTKVTQAFREKSRIFGVDSSAILVSPSKWLAKQAAESQMLKDSKIYTIPNPVDCGLFSSGDKRSARDIFEISNDTFVIGCSAANLKDPMKNIKAIIDGVGILQSQFPSKEIQILAVGDGRLESRNVKVQTTGLIRTPGRMVDAYRAMDVFVSMSLSENLPMTLVEAAAVGVPVVCLNIGGMPEIVIDGDSGRVLDSTDDLPNVLTELLSSVSERQRMARNARTLALSQFDLPKVLKKYAEVYSVAKGG
jgi:glycosyltransferase involved in cell wall biosynthesis